MKNPLCLCAVLLVAWSAASFGQNAAPAPASGSSQAVPSPTPPTPKLTLSPGMSCTATITHPSLEKYMASHKDFKPLGSVPTERTFDYSGKDSRVTTKFLAGQTKSAFIRGGYYLAWDTKSGPVILPLNSPGTVSGDIRGTYFPELSWLDSATYEGLIKFKDTKYHVFQGTAVDGSVAKLYLSEDTLYPSFMTCNSEQYTYTYADNVPVNQRFTLPKELADRWQLVRERSKKYMGLDIKDE